MSIEVVIEHYGGHFKSNKCCCPIHEEATPSLIIYPNTDSWYCFGACGKGGDAIEFVKLMEGLEFKEAVKKVCEITGVTEEVLMQEKKETKEVKKEKAVALSKEIVQELIATTGYKSNGYRGIRDDVNKFFGHLSKLDANGKVIARYYPETNDDKLTGYKCRNHPKDFSYGKIGETGGSSQLSGQIKFKTGGKYCLYVGGEEDKAAAYQMLIDHQKERGQDDYAAIPVVSPTSGEGSAAKQAAAQYDWFNMFDVIIIGMDNDKAGLKASKEIAEVLPKSKVKIASWSLKDPNKMLEDGYQKQFIRDFYNAKDYINTGIKTSIDADAEMREELSRPKISLPPFMRKLEDMFAGGIPLGVIINIIAQTGGGKTTIVNEAIRHWIYTSPYKPGILSLELTAPQYQIAMLSREIGQKITLIRDPQEAMDFIERPEVMEARIRLRENAYGEERYSLLDDREGRLEHVIQQCEILINKHGCKLLIIDPIQDLFEGETQEEQLRFIKWEKITVKKGVTIVNVCHIRKSGNSTDKDGKRIVRELTEDDVHGLSALVKSAAANIFATRDKYSTDPVKRNTTQASASKIRWTGLSGNAGEWYYCNEKHTMYELEDWLEQHGDEQYEPPQVLKELEEGGVFSDIAEYVEYVEIVEELN